MKKKLMSVGVIKFSVHYLQICPISAHRDCQKRTSVTSPSCDSQLALSLGLTLKLDLCNLIVAINQVRVFLSAKESQTVCCCKSGLVMSCRL